MPSHFFAGCSKSSGLRIDECALFLSGAPIDDPTSTATLEQLSSSLDPFDGLLAVLWRQSDVKASFVIADSRNHCCNPSIRTCRKWDLYRS